MFDYEALTPAGMEELINKMSFKQLRWLAAHHPDNRTRKIFLTRSNIEIGEDTVVNQNFIVSDNYKPLLFIGKRVAISPNVTVICASGPNNSLLNNNSYVKEKLICEKRTVIGDDVWIGANTVILEGISIGERSVIGAGSVVTKNVLPDSVYAGNPAKFIRKII